MLDRLRAGSARRDGGSPATRAAADEDGGADTPMPALFCPGPVRDNPALGEEVNERLVDWAEEVGIYPGQLERLRACGFGRLIMLTHPATDDPDRLLAATKCVVAEWAADDYYVDEVELGADPNVVGSRLALLYAVVDPAALPAQYAPQLDEHRRAEAIVTAFRSAMEHLALYASDTQMGRFQHQMGILFMAWSQEADWHRNGRTPPVWEYLVQRHLNSYLPPMILIDVVAGYELPPHEFYDPLVRRAFTRAGAANVLLNDLHSLGVRVGHGLQPAARDRRRGRLLVRAGDPAHRGDPQRADAHVRRGGGGAQPDRLADAAALLRRHLGLDGWQPRVARHHRPLPRDVE